MAAVKGVNKTLVDAGGLQSAMLRGQNDARRKSTVDSYEAAVLVLASTIQVGSTLPKGARIKEIILHADALGGSVTLAVGDSVTADRYITATAMNTANKVTKLTQIAGRDYVIGTNTGDNQIVITTAGASASGTIKIEIQYTQD